MQGKYAKFNKFGELEFLFSNKIETEHGFLVNPTEEQLLQYGWKPVIYYDRPDDEEGFEIYSEINEEADRIVVVFIKMPIDQPLENELLEQ